MTIESPPDLVPVKKPEPMSTYTASVIALQALAAFAAIGIFVIQMNAYADGKKERKNRSRRSK